MAGRPLRHLELLSPQTLTQTTSDHEHQTSSLHLHAVRTNVRRHPQSTDKSRYVLIAYSKLPRAADGNQFSARDWRPIQHHEIVWLASEQMEVPMRRFINPTKGRECTVHMVALRGRILVSAFVIR